MGGGWGCQNYTYSFLAQLWSKHAFPPLVQFGHYDVLCLVGGGLG